MWDVIGITFDNCAIGKTEEDARLTTIDRIVINIDSVSNTGGHLAIDDGFLITGYYLGNRNIMTAFHHPPGNTSSVDHRRFGADKEQANEEACLLCPTDEVQFVIGRVFCNMALISLK